ncbi:hypothetical protein PENTCL1PPCAC_16459, partial [Pristionchus entomophagus]
TITVTATCNADGLTWDFMTVKFNELSCGSGPPVASPCKMCAAPTLKNEVAGVFDPATTDNSGACTKMTFVCKGSPGNTNIEFLEAGTSNSVLTDTDLGGARDGQITVTAECKADGSAWDFMTVDFDTLACSSAPPVVMPCKMCAVPAVTTANKGVWGQATTDDSGVCTTMTFTCKGRNANIDFGPVISDGDPSDIDPNPMSVAFKATCNQDGTGYELFGASFTTLVCDAS